MHCQNPTEEVLKSELKLEPVLFVAVFLQPMRQIYGRNFEFADDNFHHEPEVTGCGNIRQFWLLKGDVTNLLWSCHRI